MTGSEFDGVDLDRLAEYVGGALDATPEAAEVRRLIDEDAGWGVAYRALEAATGRVRTDLAGLGVAPEPMPPDVATRLDAALRSADPLAGAPSSVRDPAASAAGSTGREVAGTRRPRGRQVSPAAGRPTTAPVGGAPPTRPARRRRWTRWTVVAAAAAGLTLFGLGANLLGSRAVTDHGIAASQGDASVASQEKAAPGGDRAATRGAYQILASGSHYRPGTLAALAALTDKPALSNPAPSPESGAEGSPGAGFRAPDAAVPAELRRLTDPADLTACLNALTTGYPVPVTVQVVDYAHFQDAPALAVLFTDGGGTRWVAAAGRDCGQSSAGADARLVVRVG